MRVALGEFACTGIRSRVGPDLQAGVSSAVSHYIRRLESGRTPIGIPRFARAPGAPKVDVDLTLDAEARAPFEREARRQGATMDRLAAHAVLVYLADLDEAQPQRALSA